MNAPESSSEAAVRDAALRWVLEREEGFAPGRAGEFAAWCAASPRHAGAVAEMERGLAMVHRLPEVAEPIERRLAMAAALAPQLGRLATIVRPALWWAGAAAAIAAGTFFWQAKVDTSVERRWVTQGAVQRNLALEDGSVLNVNKGSEIEVRLTRRDRRVTLRTGEAYFGVAHDPARPFIVSAGGVRVRAVGTAFNVRADENGVEVLVLEGTVEVTRESGESGPGAPLLGAGERARVRRDRVRAAPEIEKVDAAALRDAVAWYRTTREYASVPLRELVEQFNRHNPTKVTIVGPELEERRIGGTFALDRLEALLSLLEQEDDIVVERPAPNRVLLRRSN